MSARLRRRPLASSLVALALAGAGAAHAAGTSGPRVPPAPAVPDVNALVAQAKEFAAQAREAAKRGGPDATWLALDEGLMSLPPSWAFVGNEFGHSREIIKNAPYTAEAVTETVQVLPDGNRIVRKSTLLLARDGAGRTRQEGKGDSRSGIFIHDPMDGRSVVLNESKRTATRLPRLPAPPEPPVPPGAGAPPPPSPAGAREVDVQPGRVVVRRSGDGTDGKDVHVEVIRIGGGAGEPGAVPPPPPLPPLTLPIVPRGKGETKSLGAREFDGIRADGTLTTHTIPAGTIGNEKAIVVTSERWFSPELHVVVYAKTADPRAGETTYRLTNVKRGEPPADLFRVPADYTPRGEARRG